MIVAADEALFLAALFSPALSFTDELDCMRIPASFAWDTCRGRISPLLNGYSVGRGPRGAYLGDLPSITQPISEKQPGSPGAYLGEVHEAKEVRLHTISYPISQRS
eukprot:scaffold2534_cov364-Prasinococcus_capsulatus_cf.AAC.5